MLPSVDHLLSRRRRPNYSCRNFLRDAWLAHTGEELVTRPLRSFRRIQAPRDPCIVRFRRGNDAHVGMYLRGKVLHLAESMPRFERVDIAALGFEAVRFYQ